MTTPGFHWRGRTRRSVFATAGAAGAGLLAAACGQAATTTTTTSAAPTSAAAGASSASGLAGTIKIVSSLPRTGTDKGQTDTMVNGIKMALDEAGGKVGGATVTYEDWDDATAAAGHWDPAQETSNANKAAADKDIMVYIGTFNSGAAKLAIPILGQAGPLVMISPANTYPGLTKPGKGDKDEPDKYYPTKVRNYTRVVPADDIQGAVAAQWGKDLGAKSVYILDDQDLYGKGIADVFDASAKKIGLNVLGHEGIDPKASDYKALMTKIKNLNPDLIYYGGITADGGPQLVKDKIGAGMPNDKVKFMGPDGIQEQAFIDGTGKDAAEGVYATFGGVPPDKLTGKALDWANKYKAKYGGELASYTIYAYEAMKVALDAIQRAGKKDRKAIRDALFSTKNFDKGALGTWSFDDNGDTTITAMSGVQVQGGKWVFQKELKTS